MKDDKKFHALVVSKDKSLFSYKVEEKNINDLPANDLLIRVNYSNINYKDALSCKGNPSITRRFPHTPGIDACGTVVSSLDPDFNPGDSVIIIAKPMGLNTPGGFGQFIKIPSSWALKIQPDVSQEKLMAFGTAGFTSALAIQEIIKRNQNNLPSNILVTGASGGIGIISIAILGHLGVNVTALTTQKNLEDRFKALGAKDIIHPNDLYEFTKQNLASPQWDAAIDVTGGEVLSSLLKAIHPAGTVCVTGNVQSTSFSSNVLPFILRGITLVGINAEMQDLHKRIQLITTLTTHWMPINFPSVYKIVSLNDLPMQMDSFIEGTVFGRLVVDMS